MYIEFIYSSNYTLLTYSFHKLEALFIFIAFSISIHDWTSVLYDINEYSLYPFIFRKFSLVLINTIYASISITSFIFCFTLSDFATYTNSTIYILGIYFQITVSLLLTLFMLSAGLRLSWRIHGVRGDNDPNYSHFIDDISNHTTTNYNKNNTIINVSSSTTTTNHHKNHHDHHHHHSEAIDKTNIRTISTSSSSTGNHHNHHHHHYNDSDVKKVNSNNNNYSINVNEYDEDESKDSGDTVRLINHQSNTATATTTINYNNIHSQHNHYHQQHNNSNIKNNNDDNRSKKQKNISFDNRNYVNINDDNNTYNDKRTCPDDNYNSHKEINNNDNNNFNNKITNKQIAPPLSSSLSFSVPSFLISSSNQYSSNNIIINNNYNNINNKSNNINTNNISNKFSFSAHHIDRRINYEGQAEFKNAIRNLNIVMATCASCFISQV